MTTKERLFQIKAYLLIIGVMLLPVVILWLEMKWVYGHMLHLPFPPRSGPLDMEAPAVAASSAVSHRATMFALSLVAGILGILGISILISGWILRVGLKLLRTNLKRESI